MTSQGHSGKQEHDSDHGRPVREWHDLVMTPNYAPMDLIPDHGKGSLIWDVQGKCYLDLAAGIAVSALGHASPELIDALTEQASRYWHVSNLLTHRPAVELAQKLVSLTFAERVFFANSGAEANEAALKLARRYAIDRHGENKTEIISFHNSFHGRTFFTVCVGGQSKYSEGFGPQPGDITHLPFNDIGALEDAISERTCAVILEPVQGEGGVNPAKPEFAQAVRKLCDCHQSLLILDEVQTGVGRSGSLYLYQQLGVTPDILTSAKGLGGGFPIGAMLTHDEIATAFQVGIHGSTFGGNPMACAVASRLLDIVSSESFLVAVQEKSQLLLDELAGLQKTHGAFAEVRGAGLLLGAELQGVWKGRAREVLRRCTEEGLLILMAGGNVLRFAPALNIHSDQIRQAARLLGKALTQVAAVDSDIHSIRNTSG